MKFNEVGMKLIDGFNTPGIKEKEMVYKVHTKSLLLTM